MKNTEEAYQAAIYDRLTSSETIQHLIQKAQSPLNSTKDGILCLHELQTYMQTGAHGGN